MPEHTIYKSVEGKNKLQTHYQSYLDSFDFDVEERFVDTRFGKTHILQTGPQSAKPIIVLQGGNCINPMTLSWFSSLQNEYRIYAPDTIGHPGYSAETRVSAKDNSLALWISDIMDGLQIDKCAFIGPSYGAGIILRLASYIPDRIACSILVSPAGLKLGSKMKMISKILIPMLMYQWTSSDKHLQKIADAMSMGSMNNTDKVIVGEIFKNAKLEQEMPKMTEREELLHYGAPTLVVAGKQDIFFPADAIEQRAQEIISNLISVKVYDMGHFPSTEHLKNIHDDISRFLKEYYK
jgi:pimeloyl-ACP methyl ester carboxylesterase